MARARFEHGRCRRVNRRCWHRAVAPILRLCNLRRPGWARAGNDRSGKSPLAGSRSNRWYRSSSSLHPLRAELDSQVFWSTKWPNRESGSIISIAQSRSPTPESREAPTMSLEPGMTASFARGRARGSQLTLTMPVPWETQGRTALVKGDRCATKYPRILSCAERGTGLDHGEGEFSPVGATDHGAGLLALSSLALSISVRLRGVPASHRTGFKTASKMRLFWGQESHLVPFIPIHFYLFETCDAWPACRLTWRGTSNHESYESHE